MYQQNYYDSPHQNHYPPDSFAMRDMTYQQPRYEDENLYSSYESNNYYKTHGPSRVSASDYNYEKFARDKRKKLSCCDAMCCGCCICCPRWCRWVTCFLFLIIVALGIAIGVLAALFKKPSVDFTGLQGDPKFGLAGSTVDLNFTLGFSVNNPNIESVNFKKLTATAYYHNDTTELGGGTLNDLHIGSNSITNISFPFEMAMDITSAATQTVIQKLLKDCSSNTDIAIDYKVVATVSIIGIPISVPISNSVKFACPIDAETASILSQIQTIIGELGASGSTGILPNSTNIPESIKSLIPSNVASALKDYL